MSAGLPLVQAVRLRPFEWEFDEDAHERVGSSGTKSSSSSGMPGVVEPCSAAIHISAREIFLAPV